MDKIELLDAIDRYLSNQMPTSERLAFEQLRSESPEVDIMVVEQRFFLSKLEAFREKKKLKQNLQTQYESLVADGHIFEIKQPLKSRVVNLFRKYRKTTAIAASIAGLTALLISGLVTFVMPHKNDDKIQQLNRYIDQIKRTQNYQYSKLQEVDSKLPAGAVLTGGGSAFLIDAKGYLITSAHVLKGSGAVVVDHEGREFNTIIVHVNHAKDLAILKIKDVDYESSQELPYALKAKGMDIGEEIFTLGYPRNEITYNSGYISVQTGYNGDTSAFQLSLLANPGNSGGPVFNKNGEVIGLLSTRQTNAEGVVFAIRANEIYQIIRDWKKTDTAAFSVKLPSTSKSKLSADNRVDMLKKLNNYVFMVKAYN